MVLGRQVSTEDWSCDMMEVPSLTTRYSPLAIAVRFLRFGSRSVVGFYALARWDPLLVKKLRGRGLDCLFLEMALGVGMRSKHVGLGRKPKYFF